ncbi:MAG: ribosome silencing factor [Bacteroidales bacterium]
MEENRLLIDKIVEAIQDKKGYDITTIDLNHIPYAPYRHFVICQGDSTTQVRAIAENIRTVTREELNEKPFAVDGLQQSHWVALDFGSVLAHVFVPDFRQFYQIEDLWEDANRTDIPNLDE